MPIHWIPQNPTLKNYIDILTPGTATSEVAKTFKITLRNSLVVASSVTVISLIVGSLAAYALSRIRMPVRQTLLMGIMGTRMIPEVSLVIPLYILAARVRHAQQAPGADPDLSELCAAVRDLADGSLLRDHPGRAGRCGLDRWLHPPAHACSAIILPISAPGLVSTALFIFLIRLG